MDQLYLTLSKLNLLVYKFVVQTLVYIGWTSSISAGHGSGV